MAEPIAILDGRVVDSTEATISVADAGFVHSAAIAEMVRTFQHHPFRLDDHLARLRRGIDALDIEDPPTQQRLRAAVEQVVEANSRWIPANHELGVIIFVTTGMNTTYLPATAPENASRCTWGVHSFLLPFEIWDEAMQSGRRLVVPESKAIPAECLDPTIKWRSRVHWTLMDRAVRKVDPRAVAIPVDAAGNLTETSTANVLVVKNNRIRTPRAENTLDGVSRRVALELAEKLKIDWAWADITPDEFCNADEAMLCSTPYCLMPVASLNGRAIGTSAQRPIFDRLMSAWNDLAGIDIISQIRSVAGERRSDQSA